MEISKTIRMSCPICDMPTKMGYRCDECQYHLPPKNDKRLVKVLFARLKKVRTTHDGECGERLEVIIAKGEKENTYLIHCEKCDFLTSL